MTNLRSIRHLIWDWNGTLFDDTALCIDVMNGLLAERGLPPLDRERYRMLFDFPVIEYYRRLGFDFAKEPFEVVGAEFIRRYEARRTEARLHEGARPTLAALRDAGFRQSVLSAYHHDTLETLLRECGVREYFEEVLGSDNVYAYGKLEQGLAWIRRRGIDPGEAALIGDTRHDYEVATAMGCRCFLIADGYHPREKLEPLGVPVFDSLREMAAALGVPLNK